MEAQMIHEMLDNTCPQVTNGEYKLFYFDLHCMDMWVIAKILFDVWSITDYCIEAEGDTMKRDKMMAQYGVDWR